MGDEKHWLKPDQVEAMRDAAREGRHPRRDDAIITLLYDTGLRRGELARVGREMLDLEDELLRLPTSAQKDYPNTAPHRPLPSNSIEMARYGPSQRSVSSSRLAPTTILP